MEAARREKRKWSMRKNREGEECRDRAENAGKAELERGRTEKRLWREQRERWRDRERRKRRGRRRCDES